uniref:Glutaredoxin-like protein n=1 Tax=Pundamilia nyererei TaxID=303518 RepID=A0A3B4GTH0_9CICH
MFVMKSFCGPATLQLRLFSTRTLPTLTLFTKLVLQQVDISLPENRLWWDRYRWDIPVFHLNGQFVMKHRVDTALLDKLLQDAEGQ